MRLDRRRRERWLGYGLLNRWREGYEDRLDRRRRSVRRRGDGRGRRGETWARRERKLSRDGGRRGAGLRLLRCQCGCCNAFADWIARRAGVIGATVCQALTAIASQLQSPSFWRRHSVRYYTHGDTFARITIKTPFKRRRYPKTLFQRNISLLRLIKLRLPRFLEAIQHRSFAGAFHATN